MGPFPAKLVLAAATATKTRSSSSKVCCSKVITFEQLKKSVSLLLEKHWSSTGVLHTCRDRNDTHCSSSSCCASVNSLSGMEQEVQKKKGSIVKEFDNAKKKCTDKIQELDKSKKKKVLEIQEELAEEAAVLMKVM